MKEIIIKAANLFQKLGFWFLVFTTIGLICGGYISYTYQKYHMRDCIAIGGIVFENKVYEIKLRP
jgi:hypothetical protein